MPPTPTTCVICQAPLPPHRAPAAHVCGTPRCRQAYDRLPKDRLCTACGRPLEPRQLADRVCAAPACQQAVAADRMRARAERERRAAEFRREEARALRDQLAADAGVIDPAAYRPAVIP